MRMIRSTFLVAVVLAAGLFTGCASEDEAMDSEAADVTTSVDVTAADEAPAVAEEAPAAQAAPALFCRSHLDCFRGSSTAHFCCNNRCVRPVDGLICVDRHGEGSSE